ncbi:hypothetical protein CDAR_503181 [Caerostris darwini]|uniref:Uncharacterized protein n=1 Tax=Caerostris darwini TaxID=1538125 RepID=A0AAV4VPF1_9ARAC|nr:hypothetical protein CDAR_503181 [Caerostris darwini]
MTLSDTVASLKSFTTERSALIIHIMNMHQKLNMTTTPTGSIFALMECDDPQRHRGFRRGPVLTTWSISEPKSAKMCPGRDSAGSV